MSWKSPKHTIGMLLVVNTIAFVYNYMEFSVLSVVAYGLLISAASLLVKLQINSEYK